MKVKYLLLAIGLGGCVQGCSREDGDTTSDRNSQEVSKSDSETSPGVATDDGIAPMPTRINPGFEKQE